MDRKKYKILSVGGSIIIPKTGFDVGFLKKFRALILAHIKKGERFVLVVGGGATCRNYQAAAALAAGLKDVQLDLLGIKATYLNAEFVRALFGSLAYEEIIKNPTLKIKTSRPIVVAGGWKPGASTDYDAVLLAKQFGAKEVFNLSNIDFVYDKDPNKFKDAKKIISASWPEFKKIIGGKWKPGANLPFDPKAAKTAQKAKISVSFLKGTDLKSLETALSGRKFRGTIIGS